MHSLVGKAVSRIDIKREPGYIVGDADGEKLSRSGRKRLVDHGLHHCGRKILARKAVAAAYYADIAEAVGHQRRGYILE